MSSNRILKNFHINSGASSEDYNKKNKPKMFKVSKAIALVILAALAPESAQAIELSSSLQTSAETSAETSAGLSAEASTPYHWRVSR